MNIDFVFLKDIDFTNRDNLLFLVIASLLILIVLVTITLLIVKFVIIIRNLTRKIFGIKKNKSQLNKKTNIDTQVVNGEVAQQKIMGGNFIENALINNKKSSDDKNDKINDDHEYKKPTVDVNFKIGEKKVEGKIDPRDSYKEKESKSISDSLSKLTNGKNINKDALGLKVPSRVEENGKDLVGGSINNKNKDYSIFGDKKEISRVKLRHKLRYDSKIYEAQKEAGLYNFDRATREKLEKEVFDPVYGRNISKTDLNLSIKKLGRKMLDTKDPVQHAKIRKEIKFFKKIGGIK
jgi:hypothetical protein